MKPDIVAKLQMHLQGGIDSECRVVYLLVEIRKLLERTGTRRHYYALKFYCDWVVHTELAQAGAFRILQRFDSGVKAIQHDPRALEAELGKELSGTIRLEKFKRELKSLLQMEGLPTDLLGVERRAYRKGCWLAGNQKEVSCMNEPLVIQLSRQWQSWTQRVPPKFGQDKR